MVYQPGQQENQETGNLFVGVTEAGKQWGTRARQRRMYGIMEISDISNAELLSGSGVKKIRVIGYQLSETVCNRKIKKALETGGFRVRFAGSMGGLMKQFINYKLKERLSFSRRIIRRIRFAMLAAERTLSGGFLKDGKDTAFLLMHYGKAGDAWLHEEFQIRKKKEGMQGRVFFYDAMKNIVMKYDKPVLGYAEYSAAWHCNLRCKGCSHLSNLVKKSVVGDRECFRRNLLRLKELFAHVETFRFVGGEPFLNPDLGGLVSEARSAFPAAEIVVVTNGLLIPRLKGDVLDTIRENNVTVYISAYPPTMAKKKEIAEALKNHGVRYGFSRPIHQFQYEVGETPGNGKENYAHCSLMHCHLLHDDGRLSVCCVPMTYHENRDKLEVQREISEENWIDITKAEDGYEILQKMHHPIPFCQYCITKKKVMFPWQGGYTQELREKEFI